MDNEIEDIIKEFELWIELLDEDPTPSAQYKFSEFCYDKMPKVINAFKQSRNRKPNKMMADDNEYPKNLTPTPDEIMNVVWGAPLEVYDEILKTLMSIADTLLTISRTLENVRYSVAKLRK